MTVATSYRIGEPRRHIKTCVKQLTVDNIVGQPEVSLLDKDLGIDVFNNVDDLIKKSSINQCKNSLQISFVNQLKTAHHHKVTRCDNGGDSHNDVYDCPFIRRTLVNEATESGILVEIFNEEDVIVETEDEIGNSRSAGSETEVRTISVTNKELRKESGGDEKHQKAKERQEKEGNTENEIENSSAGVSRKTAESDAVTRVVYGSLSAEVEAQGEAMSIRKVEGVNLSDEVSNEISDGVTGKGENGEQWKGESEKKTLKRTIVNQTTKSDTMTEDQDKSPSEVPVCVERVACGKLHKDGNEHRYQKSSMPFPGNPQEATQGEMTFSKFTFTQLIHFLPALLVLNLGNCGVSGIPYCPAKQTAELGSVSTLYCKFPDNFDAVYWYEEATLDGPPLVAYYRNSEIKRGPGFRNNAYDISENGSLVISNVSLVHEKVYMVVLSTRLDTYERNNVSLKVVVYPDHDFPRIECDNCSGNYYHFDNERNIITCFSDKSRPPVNLEWINRTMNGDVPVKYQTNKIVDNKDGTYNSSTILHLTKNGNSQEATFVCRGRWFSESWGQEREILINYVPVSVQPSPLNVWPIGCKENGMQPCEVKEENTHHITFTLQSWRRNASITWTTSRPDLLSFPSYELSVSGQGDSSLDTLVSTTYKVSEDVLCEEELWIEGHVYDPVFNNNASASVRIIPKSCKPRRRKILIPAIVVISGAVIVITLFVSIRRKITIQWSGKDNRGERINEEEPKFQRQVVLTARLGCRYQIQLARFDKVDQVHV